MVTVSGAALLQPEWLSARITELGRSWGARSPRIAGTLWWGMLASLLIEPVVRAYAEGRPAPSMTLAELEFALRADGGVDRVRVGSALNGSDSSVPGRRVQGSAIGEGLTRHSAGPSGVAVYDGCGASASGHRSRGEALGEETSTTHDTGTSEEVVYEDAVRGGGVVDGESSATALPEALASRDGEASDARPCISGGRGPGSAIAGTRSKDPASALYDTLETVIEQVAEVSGAAIPALWAIIADTIGNRALDAGEYLAGLRLAADLGGRLPTPRFHEIGGRTFVQRISCCAIYEVPGCGLCTSCPKRPAAERESLLAALAARG
ncbi:hypothetical protein GCM10023318_29420 [Nocardia callitridis]|uniref:Ferric siderophore reductase C-terminal domain-containing protein n=1 Tax=Nocardia callitridis TaxID=648753 RepID=A0ABP9KA52_9NOCA